MQNEKKATNATNATVVTSSNHDTHVYNEYGRITATVFGKPEIPKEVPPRSIWYYKLLAR